jgi:hypothetical protein
MSLSQEEVDLVNMSLGRIGSKQITLSNQTTIEGINANLHYSQTRDSLLRSNIWNFAVKRLHLVSPWVTATSYTTDQYVWENSLLYKCAIDHTSGTFAIDLTNLDWVLVTDRPSFGFSYQYDIPSDCLRFDRANVMFYKVEGKLLLSSESDIKIQYIYQVTDTTIFDSLFYECLILSLALKLLPALAGTKNEALTNTLQIELRTMMSRARSVSFTESKRTGHSDWNDIRYFSGKIVR